MKNILLITKMAQAKKKNYEMVELINAEGIGFTVSEADFSRVLNGRMPTEKGDKILAAAYTILDRMIAERKAANG